MTKKVLARTQEVTPAKLVDILSTIFEDEAQGGYNYRKLEAISIIRYALASCRYCKDDITIIRTCMKLEGSFRTIAPLAPPCNRKNYLLKISNIMNACRAFIKTSAL